MDATTTRQRYRSPPAKRAPTAEPKLDPTRTMSLAGMSRHDCPTCGPESLFCRTACVNCGYDFTLRKKRSKRVYWNGAPLRAPIAEKGDNLLSLMAAKR
jgi:hypothetical protein